MEEEVVCVCMRVMEWESREDGDEDGIRKRQTSLCVRGAHRHSLYTLKRRTSAALGPCTGHNEEAHINYAMLISH